MSDGQRSNPDRLEPVATSYSELQSLPALFDAVRRPPVPPVGSAWQAVRALFQSIEVALVNLEMLAATACQQTERSEHSCVAQTIDWMVAFGRAWADLAWRIADVAPIGTETSSNQLKLTSSPNWMALQTAEEKLASALGPLVGNLEEGVAEATDSSDVARALLRYVMLERAGLEYGALSGSPSEYESFVRPAGIRAAVLERTMKSETVFTQFRAAHQMPEILVDAANDHLEAAITHIDLGSFDAAAEVLRRADRLLDATVRLTDLLVHHLQMDDYHEIRENLGLTSGSHSIGIHSHLMRELYPALATAADNATPTDVEAPSLRMVRMLIRSTGRHIDRWRLAHLSLPRTNLGGAGTGTRSLIGSVDALQTVGRSREVAQSREPMQLPPGHFRATDWDSNILALGPVERRLLEALAKRTQARFPDVQERTGRFAKRPDSTPLPARRLIHSKSKEIPDAN